MYPEENQLYLGGGWSFVSKEHLYINYFSPRVAYIKYFLLTIQIYCFFSFVLSIDFYDIICHVFFKAESPVRFLPSDNSQPNFFLNVSFLFRSLLCLFVCLAKRLAEFCKCSLRCNFTFFKPIFKVSYPTKN